MVEPAFLHPDFAVAQDENLLAVVATGRHHDEFEDIFIRHLRAAGTHTEKAALILFVSQKASPPPDAAARKKYVAAMTDVAPHSFGAAFVVAGTGFAASVQRSILVGMSLLSSNTMSTTVCSDLAGASKWFVAQELPALRSRQLCKMVDDVLGCVERLHETAASSH